VNHVTDASDSHGRGQLAIVVWFDSKSWPPGMMDPGSLITSLCAVDHCRWVAEAAKTKSSSLKYFYCAIVFWNAWEVVCKIYSYS